MDFFGQQDAARRRTRRLVLLFALGVIAIVGAVYLAVAIGFRDEMRQTAEAHGRAFWLWNATLFAWVAGLTGSVIAGGSLYKTAALARGGGESVAALLGGKPLDAQGASVPQKKLLNVVEEMALASGTAVPSVFLLGDEKAINAFAAGFSRDAAVLGVTQGTVDHLERDELQGVVAHEFSHILNGDMRLNVRLMGLLHGILVISLIGYWILRLSSGGSSSSSSSSDRKKGGGSIALFGLALYAIGWIGVLFGELIKSAIARQREFLADASAVQFTRNPQGIAGALKKIGGLEAGSRLQGPHAAQASHFFFGNGLKASPFLWRSTHPPLEERIRRLDPAWDGSYPRIAAAAAPAATADKRRRDRAAGVAAVGAPLPGLPGVPLGLPGVAATLAAAVSSAAGGPPATSAGVAAAQLVGGAGRPQPIHLAAAADLLAALPPAVADRARDPMAARAVVLALLCDRDPEVRRRQLDRVAAAGDAALARELAAVVPALDRLAETARLPLLDLAVPALRRLSAPQYETFSGLVDELVRADERLSLFEYALHRVLLRHLEPWFRKQAPPRVTTYALKQLGEPVAILLSTLAHAGNESEEAARAAFAAGCTALGAQTPAGLALRPRADCTFRRLDDALAALAGVSAPRLRDLLAAGGATVAEDGIVSGAEGELLRAIADALGCPLPPLVAAA